jgi:hypothetical protein
MTTARVHEFSMKVLAQAASSDSRRRDRELVLGRIMALLPEEVGIDWAQIPEPEVRRRMGYLIEVAQLGRGQLPSETMVLQQMLTGLPARPPEPFWPGERPLPPGTDPTAERWGFSRGIDLLRLRAGMSGSVDLLPAG